MGVVQMVRGGAGFDPPSSSLGKFVFSVPACSVFYWWVAVDVCLSRLLVMEAVELDFEKFVDIPTHLIIFGGYCPASVLCPGVLAILVHCISQ